jgi:hypothetical protein
MIFWYYTFNNTVTWCYWNFTSLALLKVFILITRTSELQNGLLDVCNFQANIPTSAHNRPTLHHRFYRSVCLWFPLPCHISCSGILTQFCNMRLLYKAIVYLLYLVRPYWSCDIIRPVILKELTGVSKEITASILFYMGITKWTLKY